MTISKAAIVMFSCLALAGMASAQQLPQQPKPRPFEKVTGVVFTCAGTTGFAWSKEACFKMSDAFRKRAAASKLPFAEVIIAADFSGRKRDIVDGFDQDKSVRVFWNFIEKNGQVTAALTSNVIYEPTTKDHPNVVPGQRIPINFYVQQAIFPPGESFGNAESVLNQINDNFFQLGEGKF